jgi:hypothetical protein
MVIRVAGYKMLRSKSRRPLDLVSKFVFLALARER